MIGWTGDNDVADQTAGFLFGDDPFAGLSPGLIERFDGDPGLTSFESGGDGR
jgi:hypothetical protein